MPLNATAFLRSARRADAQRDVWDWDDAKDSVFKNVRSNMVIV